MQHLLTQAISTQLMQPRPHSCNLYPTQLTSGPLMQPLAPSNNIHWTHATSTQLKHPLPDSYNLHPTHPTSTQLTQPLPDSGNLGPFLGLYRSVLVFTVIVNTKTDLEMGSIGLEMDHKMTKFSPKNYLTHFVYLWSL